MAVPIPIPSEGGAADTVEGWPSFIAFSRDVFSAAHPGYEDLFDGALAEFRRNPQQVREHRPLEPAVGVGVAVSSAVPFVLPVVAMFLGAVTERVVTGAVDGIEEAIRRRIARIIGVHRRAALASESSHAAQASGESAAAADAYAHDDSPGDVTQRRDAGSAPPLHSGAVVPPAASGLRLSAEEEGFVRGVLIGLGVSVEMDADAAEHLAEAVIRTLRGYSEDAP
ncbi:hypothetical protein ACF1BE_31490 [Streptomyces sp. NPDC014991]|uniref:hypothetical protein n=1 Tax=Streptomyces sp. NPDC014991 TaxID=3364935 RepID=UPI0037005959